MIFLTSLIHRPYVFAFFIVFLFLGVATRGWIKTLLFLVLGYGVAWASEASSIRTGFPYGWYFYIYENLQGEWLNAGVPVWDSLSYTFLCYSGMSLALFLLDKPGKRPFQTALVSAGLVTLLDLVMDPLAHLGDRWFLGKIYFYPQPGFYFDVPMTNFLGWFLVSFFIVFIYLKVEYFLPEALASKPQKSPSSFFVFFVNLGGPLLYFGIFLFNWAITLWLKEWWLAFFDLLWMTGPIILFIKKSIERGLAGALIFKV